MRNLKRALSLALAAVMVIGMMVVGAGAVSYNDFTDKDEIKNVDAVGMVTELGIINGLPNGTYGPTQNIDRASFTKMVALTFNGGSEPMLPDGNKVSYVDTAGTWASQYIEYCTNLGFVAGDGTTGKFNPTNPVTVSQAAKMLLVALGYNADVEQYVGSQWQMNVDADANTAGLYDGLSGSTSANLTRDNAAQMIYNALDSSMMKYEGVYDLTTGTMKPQRAELGKTLLESKFGATKLEGIVVANEYASSLSAGLTKEGYTTLSVYKTDSVTGVSGWDEVGIKTSTPVELLGHSVVAYVKGLKGATYQTVYGQPVISSDDVTVTISKGYSDADALAKDLKAGDITTVKGATVVKNFKAASTLNSAAGTAMSQLQAMTGNGIEITVIDNAKDQNFVIITELTPGTVAAYNAKGNSGDGYITVKSLKSGLSASQTISGATFDDVKGVEDVAKDDVVLYYELDGTFYIQKAESVNVTPTATTGDKTVKVGSDSYKASDLSSYYDEDNTAPLTAAVSIGDEAAFYLDNSGYVIYVDTVSEPDQYMYVTGASASTKSGFYSLTVKGVLSDGTTVTATVNKLNNASLTKAFGDIATAKGAALTDTMIENYITSEHPMVKYSVSGSSYNIAAITTGVASITQVKNNTPSLGGGVIANSNTIFLIGDTNDDFKAYTGIASAPTVSGGTPAYNCYAKDGVAKFVVVTNATTTGSAKGIYILSSSVTTAKKDGDTVYTMKAVVNGDYNESLVIDSTTKPVISAGYYANVTPNGDGSVDASKLISVNTGVLLSTFGNGVISAGGQSLAYDKDTKVIIVDGGDATVDADINEVIYINKNNPNNSNVVLVDGTGDNAGHAEYVFIIR